LVVLTFPMTALLPERVGYLDPERGCIYGHLERYPRALQTDDPIGHRGQVRYLLWVMMRFRPKGTAGLHQAQNAGLHRADGGGPVDPFPVEDIH
jgi:hypothetical protein